MNTIKLALIQMQTSLDRDENLAKAEDLVNLAAGKGADIAVLPEMFTIPYMTEWMRSSMESMEGETVAMLKQVASDNHINLLGGTFPEKADEEHCYNTSLFINREGDILATHRKIHLFDAVLDGVDFTESTVVRPGDTPTVFDTEYGRMGIAVCYDMRFPELFLRMNQMGARLVFVPAAFTSITGPQHWELLIRSRAMDNQFFVAGCSPASAPSLPFDPWGCSMVSGPWGQVVEKTGRGEDILYVEIDLDQVDAVRRKLPVMEHRRPEIYS